MEILTVKNLKFTYPLCEKPSVDGVSFSLFPEEFVLLCGKVGSGKSTLIKHLIEEIAPVGDKSGEIIIKDDCKLGYVSQNPEGQIVTDKVYHELAFALENLGYDESYIKKRIAETSSYFGLDGVLFDDCATLSGGQKQILNLACAMITSPDILVLDEPTSRLDPVSKEKFISVLSKLKDDLGTAVIIAEHNVSSVLPIADRILIMEGGKLINNASGDDRLKIISKYEPLKNALPPSLRLYGHFDVPSTPPLTLKEGRDFIKKHFLPSQRILEKKEYRSGNYAIQLKNVCFRYTKNSRDILYDLSLDVYEGEILFILGGNAAGKSTLLSVISNVLKPYSGKIEVFGKKTKDYGSSLYKTLTYLVQNVRCVFTFDTVKKELDEAGFIPEEFPYDFSPIYSMHPYDISGGQAQLLALAKAVSGKKKIILLDEPTSSLDPQLTNEITNTIKALKKQGITFIIVSHDLEFAAECADRCSLLFAGELTEPVYPDKFFTENTFYSTKINLMTRGIYKNAVTFDDAVALMEENRRE